MTQKTNSRIVIDTNKHGIRREISLDTLWKKTEKRKAWEKSQDKRRQNARKKEANSSREIQ